jgi:hypothetical protein
MKKIGLLLFTLSCVMLLYACKTSTASKCGPCPEYAQVMPVVEIRIVDKSTGADLFLSPGSPYKLSDLKISSTYTGQEIGLYVDSTQKDNRFIRLYAYPTQTFTLKLANFSSDNIAVTVKQDSPKCCPFLKISSIALDNTAVCNPCTLSELITIKK